MFWAAVAAVFLMGRNRSANRLDLDAGLIFGCIVAVVWVGTVSRGNPLQAAQRPPTPSIQPVVYTEEVKSSPERILYVRSVLSSVEIRIGPRAEETVELVTHVHRLVGAVGDQREVLWEEVGPDFDGQRSCAPGWTGPLHGGFATCSFRTVRVELPPVPTKAFCLFTDWSVYRAVVTTLRCFDPSRPTGPILEGGVSSFEKIAASENGALVLRGVGSPGMAVVGPYEIEYRWDPDRRAFTLEEVRAREGEVRRR